MKILFIGATGMLGKPVAHELILAGFELRLLSRDTEKAANLFPGTTIVKGDVLDPSSLQNAMQGMDAVYCNLSVVQSSREKDPQAEREGIDNIIAAAAKTGIRRIAYISSLVHKYEGMDHFHWWAFRVKASAVQKIKSSGIAYTIFYPSTFMETFPYQMLRGNKIGMLGKSVAPMWFIAAADFGKQVAASFRLLKDESREYNIQGPAPYTFSEANKIFIDHYKKQPLKVMKAPLGLIKFLALFSPKFSYVWRICEALNHYPEKMESEKTWSELGVPQTTLAQYASAL